MNLEVMIWLDSNPVTENNSVSVQLAVLLAMLISHALHFELTKEKKWKICEHILMTTGTYKTMEQGVKTFPKISNEIVSLFKSHINVPDCENLEL